MRAQTFLALNAAHVTVLDPRYFNGTDYLSMCLKDSGNPYDAVIICYYF